jgi:predicted nucleotidyltransferase
MLLNNQELKILQEFTRDYSIELYGRAISQKLKLNQKTTSNILKRLEKEDILKFKQEGKNKYYFLNKFNPYLKEIIKLIEINKKIDFLKKQKSKKRLFEELEKNTKGILIVFGSYSKNKETKDSDLDLFVLGSINNVAGLENSFNIEINIINGDKEKINSQEPFVKEIKENHVILKGVEEFVELVKW